MINSAEEFVRLRVSEIPAEYGRAGNEEASLATWMDVIRRFPDMKQWVIHNKTIHLEVLELMAQDRSPAIRARVAEKRKLSTELFDALSKDQSESVRVRLAHNQKAPTEVLTALANDEVEMVRHAAMASLSRRTEG